MNCVLPFQRRANLGQALEANELAVIENHFKLAALLFLARDMLIVERTNPQHHVVARVTIGQISCAAELVCPQQIDVQEKLAADAPSG
jgi:predicted HTH transcriptional regulator